MKKGEAKKLIEAFKTLRSEATDKIASLSIQAYPTLKSNGDLVKGGTRINHNGKLLRASVDLWDTEENNPENAPALWEEIQYKDGYRFIPETITVGTTFANGECGWWGNTLYKSLLDNNVWTPTQNPAGWEIV